MFHAATVLVFVVFFISILLIESSVAAPGLEGWKFDRRAAVDSPVKFVFALKQRNLAALESRFWSVSDPQSSQYREYLSIAEINNLIAPLAGDVKIVQDWLLKNGVVENQIELFSDALEVKIDVAAAEKLFQTEFYEFSHESDNWQRKVVRQFGSYSVPDEVSARLDMITGLTSSSLPHPKASNRIHRVKVHPRSPSAADSADLAVVAQTVYSLYNIRTQTFGNATNITSQGVIEFDDQFYLPSDLQLYANGTGIPISPLSDDHIVGINYYDIPGIEPSLDLQFLATVNTEAANWYWIEDFIDSEWMYEFAVHFSARTDVPQVISISYGWYEVDQCYLDPYGCNVMGVDDRGYVTRMNTEFQKMGLRGVSVIVASGDAGAHTRSDEGCGLPTLRVDYPASSPYITSVGATQIENGVPLTNQPTICTQYGTPCAASGTEVAVSYEVAGFTSGGGFSEVAEQPAYQTSAVKAYLASGVKLPPATMYNSSRRAHPDVSAVGHNALIINYFSINSVGGTSASAPIFAGVVSLLNQVSLAKSGKTLGFINPLLYQIAAAEPSAFNDITSGDNICTESGCAPSCKGWYATKGWDPVSGLGTPNYKVLEDYVSTH